MSLNQIIDKSPSLPLVCDDTLNLKGNQLRLKKKIVVPDGEFVNIDTTTINGGPYPPINPVVPLPLIANKILRTNNLATTVFWGDVPHGSAYNVLRTNALATASEWSPDMVVTGLLDVVGASRVNTLSVDGDLKFNNISGTAGQVLTKTSGTDQAWANPAIPTVRLVRFAGYFAAQDLNISAGPNPVVFDIVSSISNIASSTTGAITGISQPSATTFQTGVIGTYDIAILGYIDPTSSGIGNSDITLSIEVGGTELANACVCNSTSHNFSGTFPSVVIPAATNVRVIVRRVTGTNPLNTFASGTAVPSYSSTISFSLVNTL